MHDDKGQKSDLKGYITCDILKRAKAKGQKTGQQTPEARVGGGWTKGKRGLGCVCEGTVYSNGCMTVSEFKEMYIKMMNFTLCKLYLSTLA